MNTLELLLESRVLRKKDGFKLTLMTKCQMKHNLDAGVHKIFFVWYPTFFPKNLSYEMRDCYYQKCDKKADIKGNTFHKT